MKHFDVQSIELNVPRNQAFAYIADPARLPDWTQAFAEANDSRAVLRTPQGQVEIGLHCAASAAEGTVDWTMRFPDGSKARAYSRLVEISRDRCLFTFTLLAPPLPLEQIEGALAEQSRTLARELIALKGDLENERK
jgi:hypothetical protein